MPTNIPTPTAILFVFVMWLHIDCVMNVRLWPTILEIVVLKV